MSFLASLEGSAISVLIRESTWTYPIIISVHAIGMAIVVGVAIMLSLRALGFGARIPIVSLDPLVRLVWIGVALNVASGLLLFMADASKFVFQTTFQVKIALIICGSIVLLLLLGRLRAGGRQPDKLLAALSLLLWLGAITAGRLTAYLG